MIILIMLRQDGMNAGTYYNTILIIQLIIATPGTNHKTNNSTNNVTVSFQNFMFVFAS